MPGGGGQRGASRASSKAGSRVPAAGSTSPNSSPAPSLTTYRKRAPPSIHCGLTLSPMTSSPRQAGRRRSLLPGLVVPEWCTSVSSFLGQAHRRCDVTAIAAGAHLDGPVGLFGGRAVVMILLRVLARRSSNICRCLRTGAGRGGVRPSTVGCSAAASGLACWPAWHGLPR
jgi:hypothetical protein